MSDLAAGRDAALACAVELAGANLSPAAAEASFPADPAERPSAKRIE